MQPVARSHVLLTTIIIVSILDPYITANWRALRTKVRQSYSDVCSTQRRQKKTNHQAWEGSGNSQDMHAALQTSLLEHKVSRKLVCVLLNLYFTSLLFYHNYYPFSHSIPSSYNSPHHLWHSSSHPPPPTPFMYVVSLYVCPLKIVYSHLLPVLHDQAITSGCIVRYTGDYMSGMWCIHLADER